MRLRFLIVPVLIAAVLLTTFTAPAASKIRRLCNPAVSTTPDTADNISTSFKLTGTVKTPRSFSLADLQAMPQTTIIDSFLAGGGSSTAKFTGVLLSDLLALPNNSGEGGPVVRGWDPAKKNDILGYSVTVTGSDCYKATFGMGEISPFFGGKAVLVSLAQSAAALGDPTTPPASGPLGSGGRDGFARINNPVDQRGGRRVSNIVEIRVVAPPDSPLKILDGF